MRLTSAVCISLFLLGAVSMSTSGCYVEARTGHATDDELVYDDPPPPPAAEVEVIPASPGPDYYWIAGYHRWEGRRYVWVHGRYERRPHPNARWVAPHWEARGRAHIWIRGRWE